MVVNMLRVLTRTPDVNPLNHKARSVPVLNPRDKYGRVFFFSWLGFLIAFLSWYAFPPLVGALLLLLSSCTGKIGADHFSKS